MTDIQNDIDQDQIDKTVFNIQKNTALAGGVLTAVGAGAASWAGAITDNLTSEQMHTEIKDGPENNALATKNDLLDVSAGALMVGFTTLVVGLSGQKMFNKLVTRFHANKQSVLATENTEIQPELAPVQVRKNDLSYSN